MGFKRIVITLFTATVLLLVLVIPAAAQPAAADPTTAEGVTSSPPAAATSCFLTIEVGDTTTVLAFLSGPVISDCAGAATDLEPAIRSDVSDLGNSQPVSVSASTQEPPVPPSARLTCSNDKAALVSDNAQITPGLCQAIGASYSPVSGGTVPSAQPSASLSPNMNNTRPSAPTQPPVAAGLTTTLADGRAVPAYRALDGTLQPTSMRSSCIYALQGWMPNGQLNFFALPLYARQYIRNICSAEDVQAAEEGRLRP